MKLIFFFLATAATVVSSSKSPLNVKFNRDPLPQNFLKNKVRDTGFVGSATKARLPEDQVIPTRYDLKLIPILDTEGIPPEYEPHKTYGEVSIIFTGKPNPKITLNAKGINFTELATISAMDPGEGPFVVETQDQSPDNPEQFEFHVDKPFVEGNEYKINIKFVSNINQGDTLARGLYLSSFPDPENGGVPSYLAATQFEPTGAREAFPCFDEPHLKATFKISVGYDPKLNSAEPPVPTYVALSNTDAEPEEPLPEFPGWKLKNFKRTPIPMSTYLVAIVVAKYDYVKPSENPFGKEVRVYGPPHLVEGLDGKYMADESAKLLKEFQSYIEMDYHLDKMDSVVIPDFYAGAMENWGLNTYRMSSFMHPDAEDSTQNERMNTLRVLAHEINHQWFGNAVTCSFWDMIWLNEGFSSFFQFLQIDARNPGFKALELRQFDSNQAALEYDASDASHPIVNKYGVEGSTYDDYMNVFSTISYQKAGSVLRMIEKVLSETNFKKGVLAYLKDREFKTANQDQLFGFLNAEQGGKLPTGWTVKDVMDTWTLQSGFPLVRVTKVSNTKVFLSQERFTDVVYTPGHTLDPNHLWHIPITTQTPPKPTQHALTWLEKNIALRALSVDTTKWFVVNPDGTGFYRVLYDALLLKNIVTELNTDDPQISATTRSQLLDDYFTLFGRGYTEIGTTLSLTTYLHKEHSTVVWLTLFNHLAGFLSKLPTETKTYEEFKTYFKSKIGPVLKDIGFEQEASDEGALVMLRSYLLDWACTLDDPECREHARTKFLSEERIPVDIRPVIYCGAVAAGQLPPGDFPFMNAMVLYSKEETSAQDKGFLLNAVACTTEVLEMNSLINTLLADPTESLVAQEDIPALFNAIAAKTLEGRKRAIAHLVDDVNAQKLIEKLTPQGILDFFDTLSQFVLTSEEVNDLEGFMEKYETLEDVKDGLTGHIEKIKANRKWLEDHNEDLFAWFRDANTP